MSYNNPTPVAVNCVRVVDNNDGNFVGFLGIERAIEPFIGGLAFPGGFVDEMESIETAAAREFLDECGIETIPDHWLLRCSRITPNNRVLIFCNYQGVVTEDQVKAMQPNSEVKSFTVLTKDSKLCFSLHQERLDFLFS